MTLTVLANAIITGIIVYLFQKKFEANLQKSLFEHQTKFSRNYAKQVETLETLYQKFTVFEQAFRRLDWAIVDSYRKSKEMELKGNFADFQENLQQLEDFRKYFLENRLYLSVGDANQIERIWLEATLLQEILGFLLTSPLEDTRFQRLKMLSKSIAGSELYKSVPGLEKFDKSQISLILHDITTSISIRSRVLENLYKSVADTANKEHDE